MEAPIKRKHDACVDGSQALTNHSADFTADTPLQNLHTTLDNSVVQMDTYETHRLHNLGFEAKLLQDLKTMQGEGWAIAKLVEEYAKATSNSTLEHLVGFHKSDFTNGSIDSRKTHASVVYGAANGAVVTAMVAAGYNITAARVTGLNTAITNVTNDQGAPRADIADTVAARDAEVAECKNVLMPTRQSILNLMASYAVTKPLFYAAILDSFEILDLGKRLISDRVRVTDSVLGLRLQGALVAVTEEPALQKKSSELGIVDYSHQNLPQGNYTFVVSLKNYGTLTITNVPADDSKLTIVNVPLEKNGVNKTVDFSTLPH